ncbi:TIGR01777 family oxidoreductase [Zavarzinella formosa]|uniref:TIGR01777 family oxidoreductase n=1 Tax=Zavarzinella formosa TaxID=360055 RepID=UPI00030F8A63|nr:TIGR01777 family oxidoreductase [Zavarzinella formosa]
MRILVTGGTGLVGTQVVNRLTKRGDAVLVLSRSEKAREKLPPGATLIVGDPTQEGPWLDEIPACDGVIHLAGESIAAGRWTAEFKKRVLDSRVLSTSLIAEKLAGQPMRADGSPKAFISASAIGYYGSFTANATEFIESDLPGSGFLADVCVQWERSTEAARLAGVRVAIIRVGVVLAADGGALPKLLVPFKMFVGGPVGGGRQWMSWIHVDDLAGLFLHALDHAEASGPINGTAPEPLTNWGFGKTLGGVLSRPSWFPTPAIGLRILLGEMAELATKGQRVIPSQAKALGYDFQYPLLEKALRHLLNKKLPGSDS